MARLDQFYLELTRRIAEQEQAIFKTPPLDWSDFQQRRGAWVALTGMRDWINERAKQDPDDEDDDPQFQG